MSTLEKYGAADGASHRLAAPTGGEPRELLRLVSVDHPDRSSTFPTIPVRPVYLRVDLTHELPLIATDALGKEVARFKHLADMAHYLKSPGEPATLPFPIVREARREDGDQLSFADIGIGIGNGGL